MKLWLIRHPEPNIAAGVCYGASDVPALSNALERQVQQLVEVLPQGLRVWSSPLQRCLAVCESLQTRRADLQVRIDARLQEMNFGLWEGQPWSDISISEFDAWTADFWDMAPGGGESLHAFMARVSAALQQARACASVQEMAWVCHAGVIRAVQMVLRGVSEVRDARDWPREAPDYGQFVCVDVAFGDETASFLSSGECRV